MKQTLALIFSILALAISCVCGYVVEQSRHRAKVPLSKTQVCQVKTIIGEYQDSIQNPTFYTVEQVFNYLNNHETNEDILTDVKSIPIDVVINVAQVCLDGKPCIKLTDIINSYKQHQAVYDKLVTSGVITDVESDAPRPSDSVNSKLLPPSQQTIITGNNEGDSSTIQQ